MLLGCNEANEPPLRLHAMVAFPPKDTIVFELPAATRRCSDGRSLLLESLSPDGSGVLLRLRYRDSLRSDSFPIVVPADTGAVPAATVAIRYFIRDTPHSYVLDSGSVRVRREGSTIAARTEGKGTENAIRVGARVEFLDVPLPLAADTVPCNYQP